VAKAAAVVVGAGRADVLRAQPHRRASAQRRRHLPAARERVAADPHLGVRAVTLRIGGELIDVIDGIGTDADHVEHRSHAGGIARSHTDVALGPGSSVSFRAAHPGRLSVPTPTALWYSCSERTVNPSV